MRIILLPFWLVWSLINVLFELTGRLILGVIGLVLMVIGIISTITVIGAIVGIPLVIIGFLLLVRSIF